MDACFLGSSFNGNISSWDVSNVENMGMMFHESSFDGDISEWDVSNVFNMHRMFNRSEFNGDISNWDVSNVNDMHYMFAEANSFSNDISRWNVSNVNDFRDIEMDNLTAETMCSIDSSFSTNQNWYFNWSFLCDSELDSINQEIFIQLFNYGLVIKNINCYMVI